MQFLRVRFEPCVAPRQKAVQSRTLHDQLRIRTQSQEPRLHISRVVHPCGVMECTKHIENETQALSTQCRRHNRLVGIDDRRPLRLDMGHERRTVPLRQRYVLRIQTQYLARIVRDVQSHIRRCAARMQHVLRHSRGRRARKA